ncbi:methionine adenosyltransferase, partial [Phosphitispora fastidiosa]|uniref:methionine adenosyltransferase n=1 Tax=Phosphitispora fastidiosa TaxID=2837202 RepID=UPI001E5D8998
MSAPARLVIQRQGLSDEPPFEMCEHKGIGHPDSICDGAAEAVSRALCRAYLQVYGNVQHYNVDKALLVGGQSAPRFGGGRVLES